MGSRKTGEHVHSRKTDALKTWFRKGSILGRNLEIGVREWHSDDDFFGFEVRDEGNSKGSQHGFLVGYLRILGLATHGTRDPGRSGPEW
jgi:hypothetical protein